MSTITSDLGDDPEPRSPFVIDIDKLLDDHIGSKEMYTFIDQVDRAYFTEIHIHDALHLEFELIRREYGVELRILLLQCRVGVLGENILDRSVYLSEISREYHIHPDPHDTDDVLYIDTQHLVVDISQAIEQEILISCLL